MARNVCPECVQGKHGNCDGTAWHDERDEVVVCDCYDAEHEEPKPGRIPAASTQPSTEIEHIRARVTDARDGAALRLPGLTGESAATVRGWAAAMDEVLAFLPSPPAKECACEAYTIRTDYGTGIEHDVDRSSCSIHGGADDA